MAQFSPGSALLSASGYGGLVHFGVHLNVLIGFQQLSPVCDDEVAFAQASNVQMLCAILRWFRICGI